MKLNITCKHFKRGFCKYGKNCKFVHNNMYGGKNIKKTGEDNTNIEISKSDVLNKLKKNFDFLGLRLEKLMRHL